MTLKLGEKICKDGFNAVNTNGYAIYVTDKFSRDLSIELNNYLERVHASQREKVNP